MMKTRPKGFTLVETLVAISILMISIAGPYYSVYKAVQTTYIARDKLIATALSQEGIEYVRNKRDSNYLYNLAHPTAKVDWLNGLSACKGAGAKCTVDATVSSAPVGCNNGTCTALYTDTTSNWYTQAQTPNTAVTRYTRSVNITDVTANEETIVTVTVSWQNSHITNSIVVTEHLYNWL